jgi:hypothetical protein
VGRQEGADSRQQTAERRQLTEGKRSTCQWATPSDITVLQRCNSCVTAVLQHCYSSATVVSQQCNSCVTESWLVTPSVRCCYRCMCEGTLLLHCSYTVVAICGACVRAGRGTMRPMLAVDYLENTNTLYNTAATLTI